MPRKTKKAETLTPPVQDSSIESTENAPANVPMTALEDVAKVPSSNSRTSKRPTAKTQTAAVSVQQPEGAAPLPTPESAAPEKAAQKKAVSKKKIPSSDSEMARAVPETVSETVQKLIEKSTPKTTAKAGPKTSRKAAVEAPVPVVSAAPSMSEEFDIPSRKTRKPAGRSTPSKAAPVVQNVPEPVLVEPEPIAVEPTLEPVIEAVAEPILEPVLEPVGEPVLEPANEPRAEQVEPALEPVVNAVSSRKGRASRAKSAQFEAAKEEPTLAAVGTALEEVETELPSSETDLSQPVNALEPVQVEAVETQVLELEAPMNVLETAVLEPVSDVVPSRKSRTSRKKALPETPLLEAEPVAIEPEISPEPVLLEAVSALSEPETPPELEPEVKSPPFQAELEPEPEPPSVQAALVEDAKPALVVKRSSRKSRAKAPVVPALEFSSVELKAPEIEVSESEIPETQAPETQAVQPKAPRPSRRKPAKTPVSEPHLLEVVEVETPIEVTVVPTLKGAVTDAVQADLQETAALYTGESLESQPSQPTLESQPSSESVPVSGERPSRRRRRERGEPRSIQTRADSSTQSVNPSLEQTQADSAVQNAPDDDIEITSGNLDVYGIYQDDSSENEVLQTSSGMDSSATDSLDMDSSGMDSAQTDSSDIDAGQPDADRTGRTPEDAVLEFFRRHRKPWHVRDLERGLPRLDRTLIGGKRDLEMLLEGLTEAGTLIRTRKHTYGLVEVMNLVRGRFQGNSKGFGFVIPEDDSEDLYIASESTLEAWNGDTVLARVEGRRGREESPRGTIARIVKRGHDTLVGTLEFSKGYALLKPDDPKVPHRVLLLPDNLENVKGGARVLANLFWPEATGEDEVYGEIQDILGDSDNPETETKAVILKHDLRDEFSPEVEREAERVALELSESNYVGRLDLRDRNIFTVDGRDAKDFDDAIHIEALEEGGFLVGVHIADVSFYVREGSVLDEEAYLRATSVYLPGKVLPMLPEKLSNGVCSLVPDQDRLTLSAMIQLSSDGEVQAYHLAPSVIHSKARLTYDEVQAYSEGAAPMPVQARALEGDLHLLLKLTAKMRTKRLREGALDFKLREVKVEVDREGNLTLIPIREETARGMIEDLMLLANKVVAGYMLEKNVPALYRIHQDPSPSSFQEVSTKIARLGLAFPGNTPTPQNYQAVLKQARGTPQESFVNQALLRSLQQAKYSHENLGHFGLAFDEYLHFTSPIRRYPDLQVHRALRASLEGKMRGAFKEQLEAKLPEMGTHTSERERAATEAERDLTKYYQAKWAQAHLGQGFYGSVSGIIARGMFVALENGVEGFVHVSELGDDYFIYLEEAQMFRGRSSGRSFRFGDEVFVRIEQVNPLARQIDLALDAPENFDMADDNNFRPRARRGGRDERPARTDGGRGAGTPAGNSNARPQDGRPSGNVAGNGAGNVAGNVGGRPPQDRSRTPEARTTPVSNGEFSRPNAESGQASSGQANTGQASSGQARGGRPTFQPSSGQFSGEGRAREERGNQGSHSSGHSSAGGGTKRRIVTLERTRPEYSRPVNVTVQRVYFGDWNGSNLKADENERDDYRRGGNSGPRADRGFQGRPPRGGVSVQPRNAGESSQPARGEGRPARASSGSSQPRTAQARAAQPRPAQPRHAQAQAAQVIVPQEQEAGSSAEGTPGVDGAARRRRRRRRRPSGTVTSSSEG